MNQKLKLNNDQLRALVLETLKENKKSQFEEFDKSVADKALSKGLLKQDTDSIFAGSSLFTFLVFEDIARVRDILWDLIIEGIIRPGFGDGLNNDLPFFHVTEKGEQILSSIEPTP